MMHERKTDESDHNNPVLLPSINKSEEIPTFYPVVFANFKVL